jgi:hypothetical protein
MKKTIPQVKKQDSLDEIIQFEGQSLSENKKDQIKSSPQKSSPSQDDDSEVIEFIFILRN